MLQSSTNPVLDTVQLGFEQTVPRAWVHKRSHENVLLTDLRTCAGDRFIGAGHVPTAHAFFNHAGRTPQKDILFYTELGRQASLAISHRFLEVSTDDVFVFEQSAAALTDAALRSARRSRRDPVIVDVRILETARRKNNSISRVTAEHVMSIANEEVFRGTGAWTVQPAALFRRLRRLSGARPSPAPVDVATPGTDASADHCDAQRGDHVVITAPAVDDAGALVTSLIVDDTHPYFFDHPCDHVPGMLLLEGCAQLARAAARIAPGARDASAIRAYDVNFAQFVECGAPTTLTANVTDDQAIHIAISQQNVVSGTTTMRVAFPI